MQMYDCGTCVIYLNQGAGVLETPPSEVRRERSARSTWKLSSPKNPRSSASASPASASKLKSTLLTDGVIDLALKLEGDGEPPLLWCLALNAAKGDDCGPTIPTPPTALLVGVPILLPLPLPLPKPVFVGEEVMIGPDARLSEGENCE